MAMREMLQRASDDLDGGHKPSRQWVDAIATLSRQSEEAGIRTHIAFVGTAILAKAAIPGVDVYAHKTNSAKEGAYNARGVVDVLVKAAKELGMHIGTTGPEPLNNQPYFGIKGRIMPEELFKASKKKAWPVIETELQILDRLQKGSQDEALEALRAFIFVRRQYKTSYPTLESGASLKVVGNLIESIEAFVKDASEGGKRAQAVAAGVMDLAFGRENVLVTRVNASSKRLPGDVGVRSPTGDLWRAVEVRDKMSDAARVIKAVEQAAKAGVSVLGFLAVAHKQPELDAAELESEARLRGVDLHLYIGWKGFVRNAIFWHGKPAEAATAAVVAHVRDRLIEIEASAFAVELWLKK